MPPIWYLSNPRDSADKTELAVAQTLNQQLSTDWLVRWCFYYKPSGDNKIKDHEGDFLIIGPDGRILVMEVKGGNGGYLRKFVLTGKWSGQHINPAKQIHDEWKGVLTELRKAVAHQKGGKIPYVGRAICVPHMGRIDKERLTDDLPPECLIFREDLADFKKWWERCLAIQARFSDPHNALALFKEVWARDLKPGGIDEFMSYSDQLFEQFQSYEFEVLEMLEDNQRWMVEGGTGTGKGFMALKRACHLAQQGLGMKVLLIAYHEKAAQRLSGLVPKLGLLRGAIHVRTWAELLTEIAENGGKSLSTDEKETGERVYYSEVLQRAAEESLREGKVKGIYDALVVVDAQDHDTLADALPELNLGWWEFYFALLKDPDRAPVALFFDPSQRPHFRGKSNFEPKRLQNRLRDAVTVKLRKAVRFTLPVYQYLAKIDSLDENGSISLMEPHEDLPQGPEVTTLSVAEKKDVPSAVTKILEDWEKLSVCQADRVVVIGSRSTLKKSSLAECQKLHGLELVDYNEELKGKLGYLGAHRSRGLDFLAVILIDFPAPEIIYGEQGTEDMREAFFLGASRARQVLAVVSVG